MMNSNYPYIFVPSYHRPNNVKTAKYFKRLGYDMTKLVVFVDNETDDIDEYEKACNDLGCKLFVFDMAEARKRFDFVHRPSKARRSAGMARNMFYDYARDNGITQYVVQDDDTNSMSFRILDKKTKQIKNLSTILYVFNYVFDFMQRHRIGCFGLSQTGDLIGGYTDKILRWKVMNTTFYDTRYVYRGERGVQDDDTSQFVTMYNEGLFTGSFAQGLILQQTQSAKQAGGLTDLYNECRLLNKALVCPIQFPSAIHAELQEKNGGRLHHRITKRFLAPCLIKNEGGRNNIAWDMYPEDYPFTNEPKRK